MYKKTLNMFLTTHISEIRRGGRRRTDVLSGMIVWNLVVLVLLVLAVCVQGQLDSVSSQKTSLPLRLARETVKKQGVESSDLTTSAEVTVPSQPPQGNVPVATAEAKEQTKTPEEKKEISPESTGGNTSSNNTKVDIGSESLPAHSPTMTTEALLRGFYVLVGVGSLLLIYIVIKMMRLRKNRSAGKYRVLSHSDDQEMFPLAAGEGEDEEIFNAAQYQSRK